MHCFSPAKHADSSRLGCNQSLVPELYPQTEPIRCEEKPCPKTPARHPPALPAPAGKRAAPAVKACLPAPSTRYSIFFRGSARDAVKIFARRAAAEPNAGPAPQANASAQHTSFCPLKHSVLGTPCPTRYLRRPWGKQEGSRQKPEPPELPECRLSLQPSRRCADSSRAESATR